MLPEGMNPAMMTPGQVAGASAGAAIGSAVFPGPGTKVGAMMGMAIGKQVEDEMIRRGEEAWPEIEAEINRRVQAQSSEIKNSIGAMRQDRGLLDTVRGTFSRNNPSDVCGLAEELSSKLNSEHSGLREHLTRYISEECV